MLTLLQQMPVLIFIGAILFNWLSTFLGASLVYFTNKENQQIVSIALGSSAGIMIVQDFILSYSKSLRIRPTSVYVGKVSRRGCWSYLSQIVRGAQSQDRSPSGVLYQSGGYRDTTTYLSWGY